MPKATISLPDGTTITIDGSVEEIDKLIKSYGASAPAKPASPPVKKRKRRASTPNGDADKKNR